VKYIFFSTLRNYLGDTFLSEFLICDGDPLNSSNFNAIFFFECSVSVRRLIADVNRTTRHLWERTIHSRVSDCDPTQPRKQVAHLFLFLNKKEVVEPAAQPKLSASSNSNMLLSDYDLPWNPSRIYEEIGVRPRTKGIHI